jgi:hypothetical protein
MDRYDIEKSKTKARGYKITLCSGACLDGKTNEQTKDAVQEGFNKSRNKVKAQKAPERGR